MPRLLATQILTRVHACRSTSDETKAVVPVDKQQVLKAKATYKAVMKEYKLGVLAVNQQYPVDMQRSIDLHKALFRRMLHSKASLARIKVFFRCWREADQALFDEYEFAVFATKKLEAAVQVAKQHLQEAKIAYNGDRDKGEEEDGNDDGEDDDGDNDDGEDDSCDSDGK